jgi:hypothetical protein
MQPIPTGFLTALAAANGALPPMTMEEKAAFRSELARVVAEDDRKRDPGRQFELEAA